MPLRIEDYGIVGDLHTAAVVGYDAGIDWLCLPRIDSEACFAALLGDRGNGTWRLGPAGAYRTLGRRYRPDTLVLETDLACDEGVLRVVDFMPPREDYPRLLRVVECLQGTVTVRSEVVLRFDYGYIVPWLVSEGRRVRAFAGPAATTLDAEVEQQLENDAIVAETRLEQGESTTFALEWTPVRRRPGGLPTYASC